MLSTSLTVLNIIIGIQTTKKVLDFLFVIKIVIYSYTQYYVHNVIFRDIYLNFELTPNHNMRKSLFFFFLYILCWYVNLVYFGTKLYRTWIHNTANPGCTVSFKTLVSKAYSENRFLRLDNITLPRLSSQRI